MKDDVYSEERRLYAERMKNAPQILAEKKTWNYSIFGPLPEQDKAVITRQVGEWYLEQKDPDEPGSIELVWEWQADGTRLAIAGPFPSPFSDLADGYVKAHNKCIERMTGLFTTDAEE